MAVLTNMYQASGDDKKAGQARSRAHDLADRLKQHFAESDYSYRAGSLVYKLDQDVPVFGIDLQ